MINYSEKSILAVMAHPDDETFAVGGTLAHYARRGAEVNLVCCTHGEAGDVKPEYLEDFDSIADLRESELRCAAQKLGISQVVILDHRDSGMPDTESNRHPEAFMNVPVEKASAEIALQIRRLKPNIVITHDPVGNYFHPDHIAANHAAEKAFYLAADPGVALDGGLPAWQADGLYFFTLARKRLKSLLWIMPLMGMDPSKTGRNGDINMERILNTDFPVHVEINFRREQTQRDEASQCHASQGGGNRSRSFYWFLRRSLAASTESFIQSYPQPKNGRVRKDFFEKE